MLTQDQKNAIQGEGVFCFAATVGAGSPVSVQMSYEYDSEGIYNETIDSVKTLDGYSIADYLEENTLNDLCLTGCTMFHKSIQENI